MSNLTRNSRTTDLIIKIIHRRVRRRHMLREDLQPFRGRETVSYDERAQVQEFRRHDCRLLRRNDYSRGQMTLLSDNRQERVGQSSRASCLRFRKVLQRSQQTLLNARIEAVTLWASSRTDEIVRSAQHCIACELTDEFPARKVDLDEKTENDVEESARRSSIHERRREATQLGK